MRSDMEKLRMNFKGPIFRFRFNNETGEEIDPQLFKIVFREICFELNADGSFVKFNDKQKQLQSISHSSRYLDDLDEYLCFDKFDETYLFRPTSVTGPIYVRVLRYRITI